MQEDATLPSAESSTLVKSSSSAQQSAPQEPERATTTDQGTTWADTNTIAEGSTVQPTTSQDTNLAWASAAEDDENAAEDELDTIDPVNFLDSYPNYNKRPAFIVIAKNSEVAVIDSFVEKAIRKIKVRLTTEELYNANLHIRVAPMPVHDKTAACLEKHIHASLIMWARRYKKHTVRLHQERSKSIAAFFHECSSLVVADLDSNTLDIL